jgi:hypothetical protein
MRPSAEGRSLGALGRRSNTASLRRHHRFRGGSPKRFAASSVANRS